MNFFRRFRDALVTGILLAIPFFVLNANLKTPAKANPIDRMILQMSAPVQYVAVHTARSLSLLLERYTYLVEVKRDHALIKRENVRLLQEQARLEQEARENRRLRALLGMRQRLPGEYVTASVVAKDASRYFRVIRVRLDRGIRDRIKRGMPVIAADGLVGRIQRVSDRYSDVLLSVDRNSKVDVVVARNGARGTLHGTGENDRYRAEIQHLLKADQVNIGDVFETSGWGKHFPSGLPVGRVIEVSREEAGMFQIAAVEPVIDVARLREVLIMVDGPLQQRGGTDSGL